MKNKMKILTLIIASIFLINLVSALIIKNVDVGKLYPGEDVELTISVKNDADYVVEDVSLSLDFSNLPLTSIGSSEKNVDEINEDDSESFNFRIKADSTAKLGSYNLPYNLKYDTTTQKGTIGIEVSGKTELQFSALTENPVINQKGKISLKIVNKGLADARFVSVKIFPSGYTLLGSDEDYIGTISSDDFETASFDVIFNSQNSILTARVDYRDFENNQKTENVNLALTIYSRERALELGIISKSYVVYYVVGVVVIIILYLIYRAIRKRGRLRKAEESRS